jgi:hypothetical protein
MNIKEINGKYIADEDRIFLRIKTLNNEEYRFWLTRKWAKVLIDHLQKADFEKKLAEKFKQVQLKSDATPTHQTPTEKPVQLKSEYDGGEHLPLGADPILIKTLAFNKIENMPDNTYKLTLQLGNGMLINSAIPQIMLKGIAQLISQLSQVAGWDKWSKEIAENKLSLSFNDDTNLSMH